MMSVRKIIVAMFMGIVLFFSACDSDNKLTYLVETTNGNAKERLPQRIESIITYDSVNVFLFDGINVNVFSEKSGELTGHIWLNACMNFSNEYIMDYSKYLDLYLNHYIIYIDEVAVISR